MNHCECNCGQECFDCFSNCLKIINDVSTYEEILEISSKLHLENYFTTDIMEEMKRHLSFKVSFNKTLVYCIDKVLRRNDRYIPVQTLCHLNNITLKDYKTFIKNHSQKFVESVPNLSIDAYAQYMCNQLFLTYKQKKTIVQKSNEFHESHPTIHPLAIVCAHILYYFPTFKVNQMSDFAYVSVQSIQKVFKCLRNVSHSPNESK